MKKPSFPVRIAILMAILCIPPIGATQIGWYYFGQTMGVNFGMAAGVVSVITCLLYTSPSPRDRQKSRMPSSA